MADYFLVGLTVSINKFTLICHIYLSYCLFISVIMVLKNNLTWCLSWSVFTITHRAITDIVFAMVNLDHGIWC